MKRVALIGQNGQVTTYLQRKLATVSDIEVVVMGRDQLDLSQPDTIYQALAEVGADLIINPAAYTAVDLAETERETCTVLNRDAVKVIAKFCVESSTPLVHFSTDYVFPGDGSTPYKETDPTGPTGVYGQSKLEGEQAILASGAPAIILRTAWVYSNVGKNFYKTMLALSQSRTQLNVVNDQVGSPTYAGSIADATTQLCQVILKDGLEPRCYGVYHLTCQGQCHWAEFARSIFKVNGIGSVVVDGIPSSEYPTPAKRPAYSVLSNAKLADTFGIALPNWLDALHTCALEGQLGY